METVCHPTPVPQCGFDGVPPLVAEVWPEFCEFARVRRLVSARWLKRSVAVCLRIEDERGQTLDWVLKRHPDEASAQNFRDFAGRLEEYFREVDEILVSSPQAVFRNWVAEPYIPCRSIRWALLRLGPDAQLLEALGSRYAAYLWHIHSIDDGPRQSLRAAYEPISNQYIERFMSGSGRLAAESREFVARQLGRLGGLKVWEALRHTDYQVNNLCYTTAGKAVIFDPEPHSYGLNVKDLGELIVSLDTMPSRYPFVSARRIRRFRRAFVAAYGGLSGEVYPDALWNLIGILYSWERLDRSRQILTRLQGACWRRRLKHLLLIHRQQRLIARYLDADRVRPV